MDGMWTLFYLFVWFFILDLIDLIPDKVFGSVILSVVLYFMAFLLADMFIIKITSDKRTVVIENKAEKVRKGLFGTITRRIIRTTDGQVFECVNYWPLIKNAKESFKQIKVGKKYQIVTCCTIMLDSVRKIIWVNEVKTNKKRAMKKSK